MPSDEMVEKVARAVGAALERQGYGLRDDEGVVLADIRGGDFVNVSNLARAALAAAEAGEPVASWECFRDEAFFDMWCVRPKGERRFGHSFHVTTEEEAEGLVALLSASPPSEASRDERAAIRKEAFEEAAEIAKSEADRQASLGCAQPEGHERDKTFARATTAEAIYRRLLVEATAIRARGET